MTETTKRNMTENASANITQLLASFDSYVKIVEDPMWIRTANIEEIKTTFKLGTFIEKTTAHFKSNNTWDHFLYVLTEWWTIKDRTKQYSDKFYSTACDELLCTFFRCSDISEYTLDIAIRIYTSLLSRKRFEEVLTKLFLDAGNLEAVMDYLKTTDSMNYLEYDLKLQTWVNLLQVGDEIYLKEEIKDMLAPYNVEQFLYILIGLLSLTDISDHEKNVQNIVLEHVLEKMLERSILTKQLWFTLVKNIDKMHISRVCQNFKEFLKSFLNFIVYIGGMMIQVGNTWKSDPTISFYPEISYEDIFCHIYNLIKLTGIKVTVIDRLNEAKDKTTSIWEQVLFELNGT